MRILIDVQACQIEGNRVRGIGRYALALIKEILEIGNTHEFVLLANRSLTNISHQFCSELLDSHRQIFYCEWYSPGALCAENIENKCNRLIAKHIRDYAIQRLQPQLVYIPSFFDGFRDDSVLGISNSNQFIPIVVTHYDLIPLSQSEIYLDHSPAYNKFYRAKVEEIKSAEILFTISNFVAKEAEQILGLPSERIVNISSACDQKIFNPTKACPGGGVELPSGISINFILYCGAADPRKNLKRLIQAYALLPITLQQKYQLVLVGSFNQYELTNLNCLISELKLKKANVLITGYVNDALLAELYRSAAVFVYPSLHEGFGLPALEAMCCGAVVIGSNSTSVAEVINEPQALFDPCDIINIKDTLEKALTDPIYRKLLLTNALKQMQNYSWQKSAFKALSCMEELILTRGDYAIKSLPWLGIVAERNKWYRNLIEEISEVVQHSKQSDVNTELLAEAIAFTELQSDPIERKNFINSSNLNYRVEGPYDSSYSLSILNRHFALELSKRIHNVSLFATEGPGDYKPDALFIDNHPDIGMLAETSKRIKVELNDIVSRNLYPPRVTDMQGRINMLHAYGWEETGFPSSWVHDFNQHLHGITVMSEHVRKVLIDNGVYVPISVCGVGCDHLMNVEPEPFQILNLRSYRFLHVSSCFPRKGVEELIVAYGFAFSINDDVSLIIKTFPNPHNNIHKLLEIARAGNDYYPHVIIIEDDLSSSKIKYLYDQVNCLVAPSKAEGFGLPLVEAMLQGIPVIATGWSGQLDFCSIDTAWLIDYSFEFANTHFGLWGSLWAKPNVQHLTMLMKQLYTGDPNRVQEKCVAAKTFVKHNYLWKDVVDRVEKHLNNVLSTPQKIEFDIAWISTWNIRCGIASYSANLIASINSNIDIYASRSNYLVEQDSACVKRCWDIGDGNLLELQQKITERNHDAVVIQFNFGFFSPESLYDLILSLRNKNIKIFIFMHSTIDPEDKQKLALFNFIKSLNYCDRVLVHTPADLNRLKGHGLIANCTLFPHGIPFHSVQPMNIAKSLGSGSKYKFNIASYGYFLPHKGLLELIKAVRMLIDDGINVKLHMLNAEYPAEISASAIKDALNLIDSLSMQQNVALDTSYSSDINSLDKLAAMDFVVYPYQSTGESASGAVRLGLASGAHVLVTPLPIFDDVSSVTFRLPGESSEMIYKGLHEFINKYHEKDQSIINIENNSISWRDQYQFSKLGIRLYGMIAAVVNSAEKVN